LVHEPCHRFATIERKHERNILEEQPSGGRISSIEKSKDVLDQTRLRTRYTCRSPRLTEVLAGKASGDQVTARETI